MKLTLLLVWFGFMEGAPGLNIAPSVACMLVCELLGFRAVPYIVTAFYSFIMATYVFLWLKDEVL